MTKEKPLFPPLLMLGVGLAAVSFSAIFIKWSNAPAGVLGMYRLVFTVLLLTPWVWRIRNEFTRFRLREWLLLFGSGLFLGGCIFWDGWAL